MPRAKSVILTPAEKKEALAATRAELKGAKLAVKEIMSFVREKEKLHAQSIRLKQKELKDATKIVETLTSKINTLNA